MAHKLKLFTVTALLTVAVIFVADQLLGLLGFPADTPFRVAHRENQTKVRTNIEFEFEFSTNEHGLRYAPIEQRKSPGEVRILLLGDSFTEGVGIEAADTFGMALENYYANTSRNEVRFVNAGLGGQGPIEFWRVFRDVGLELSPDGLLICIYANDLADTSELLTPEDLYREYPERVGWDRRLHALLPRVYTIVNESIRIFDRERRKMRGFVGTVEVLAAEQGVSREAFHSWKNSLPEELVEASDAGEFNKSLLSVGLFNPDYWREALDISTPKAEQKYESFTLVLNEINTVARQRGIESALVYIPSPLQYDPSRHAAWNPWIIGGARVQKEWLTEETELQRRLARWASANDVPFLDLAPALREAIDRGGELNYKLDGHWNVQGHRSAGAAILKWLQDDAVFSALSDKSL